MLGGQSRKSSVNNVEVFQSGKATKLVAAMEEQHKPTRKTIRIIEEEDRISELQDCLLIDIISRLPQTKEAIRTVEAMLDYHKGGHYETTHREEKEEMFKGFILKLRNVKELTIGCYCQKVFSRLKAKGLIFPSNIKYIHWSGPSEEDEYEDDSD
ncbi:hypothetical protein Tco_0179578 [Tanacetum coccineum]